MARQATTSHQHVHFERKRLLILGLFLLLLYVVLPQIGDFHSSLTLLRHARFGWAVTGFIFTLLTYMAAAGIYVTLAVRPLRYLRSVLVQCAGMFANRLLPAGIGAIGVNYEYLRHSKHSSAQAATVVAVNNMLGIIGHLLLLSAVVIFDGRAVDHVMIGHQFHINGAIIAGIIVILIAAITVLMTRHRQLLKAIKRILQTLRTYRTHPARLTLALILSMTLTSLYGLCLWSCGQAIGIHISILQLFIVLTLGVAGGTVVPTPGGIGGAEAGLVAGLVAYGVSGADALAVALFYRLLTYWLPLIFGGFAFITVERRKLI
jgi:uncharacterized protein (TIRG00374 family)